ncbi:hypothetical protein SEA_ZETA1847_49 [Microbacterium phage Zeta1847]|uniref:Uncharacterized protein n=1 Tax=Microbacterium phage Zeta1847 TaxID=2201444 RepID=A0A2Z4QAQ2_9CAUD|nr:hypothetical protein HOT46_gp49 [Microbacterium phage Zeta1847]AWY06683.1 hypothetical protein SEA_ZETA1847_49 [Microbacterium phage Zeta1847]
MYDRSMTNTTASDIYPDLKGSDRVTVPCGRCGGTGVYSGPSNASWDNGLGTTTWCFRCGGAKTETVLVSSLRAAERRRVKAAAEARAAAEAFAARAAAYWTPETKALRDEATELHIGMREGDPLRRSLGAALELIEALDETGPAAVRVELEAIAARDAAKVAAPEGRVELEGVIVGLKYREPYAYGAAGSWAAVIECDGFKVYGTLPSSISAAERGTRVAFTATLERSEDDASFAYYKRPTKARILEAAE